jgi:hypothetical protein
VAKLRQLRRMTENFNQKIQSLFIQTQAGNFPNTQQSSSFLQIDFWDVKVDWPAGHLRKFRGLETHFAVPLKLLKYFYR